MNRQKSKNVLVLGGKGFIGRHVVASLQKGGHQVTVSTRANTNASNEVQLIFHKPISDVVLNNLIKDFDVVINTVGILRQRYRETYDQVHHRFVRDLARTCAQTTTRFIHVSALGLQNEVRSRFLLSKRCGEQAIKEIDGDWAIVRPSLIDGDGGYGAKWFRRLAAWPIHLAPANANGLLCPIHVRDLADAILSLAEAQRLTEREYEFGGADTLHLLDYLALLKGREPVLRLKCPAFLVRLISHLFDFLHLTPLSFGHYELLQRNNIPARNAFLEVTGVRARKFGHREVDIKNKARMPFVV